MAGYIAPSVVRIRPDLRDMGGYTVRVPRSLDIDMNEDSQRVRVPAPDMEVESDGVRFRCPTIALSADELKLVKRCVEGRDDAKDVLGNEDPGREMDIVEESTSRPENLVGQLLFPARG